MTIGTPDWAAQLQQAKDQIANYIAEAEQRKSAAEAAGARFEQLRPQGWSNRREVGVTLDANGQVSDIVFSDTAPSIAPGTLSLAIKRAHDRALAAWADEVEVIADEEYRDQPELRAQARSSAAQLRPILPED